MRRGDTLKAGIARTAALPTPRLARTDILVFLPQADPAQPDPIWVRACVARDTLFALSTRLNAAFASLIVV